MDNWLLIIVGIIFLLCMVNGGIKGFFKIGVSLLSSVLTIVLVIFLSPYVEEAIVKYTVLDEMVEEKCVETFMPKVSASILADKDLTGTALENLSVEEIESMGTIDWDAVGMSAEDLLGIVGDFTQAEQISQIENSTLPDFLKDLLLENNNSEIYEALGVSYFPEYVAAYMSNMVVQISAFLITFLFAIIIVKALSAAVEILGDLPGIGVLNHLGGVVLGFALAVIIVWILFLALTAMCTTQLGMTCFDMIEESGILTFLYDTNILLDKLLQI